MASTTTANRPRNDVDTDNVLRLADPMDPVERHGPKGFDLMDYGDAHCFANTTELIQVGEVTGAVREAAGCETAAGIAAWATVLFDAGFNENDNPVPPRVAASKALGLNEDQADCRFVPAAGELPDNLIGREIGPAHAAATLRHPAATGVVEWRPFTSPHHVHQ